jgi:hypothetical protein
MAYNAKKTEHAGAKKGRGAFYGPKAEAKKASNRRRAMHPRIVARLRRQLDLLEFADSRPIEDCVGQFSETWDLAVRPGCESEIFRVYYEGVTTTETPCSQRACAKHPS